MHLMWKKWPHCWGIQDATPSMNVLHTFVLSSSVPAARSGHSEFLPSYLLTAAKGTHFTPFSFFLPFFFFFFSSYRLQITNDFRRLFSLKKENAELCRCKLQCFQDWDFHLFSPNIIVLTNIFHLTSGCTLIMASTTKRLNIPSP